MSELRTQLEASRADHLRAAYPGDLAADVFAPDEQLEPPLLRLFYAAGALAAAAALTFGVMRFGSLTGVEPGRWQDQLASLGDRGKALVMSVSSRLPGDWELPDMRLPHMSRPSEFPQHLRMMSPLNRVQKPELPENILPRKDEAEDDSTEKSV